MNRMLIVRLSVPDSVMDIPSPDGFINHGSLIKMYQEKASICIEASFKDLFAKAKEHGEKPSEYLQGTFPLSTACYAKDGCVDAGLILEDVLPELE